MEAGSSHTEMEMSLCDVTINLTAVNKVNTSDVCASVQSVALFFPPLPLAFFIFRSG